MHLLCMAKKHDCQQLIHTRMTWWQLECNSSLCLWCDWIISTDFFHIINVFLRLPFKKLISLTNLFQKSFKCCSSESWDFLICCPLHMHLILIRWNLFLEILSGCYQFVHCFKKIFSKTCHLDTCILGDYQSLLILFSRGLNKRGQRFLTDSRSFMPKYSSCSSEFQGYHDFVFMAKQRHEYCFISFQTRE